LRKKVDNYNCVKTETFDKIRVKLHKLLIIVILLGGLVPANGQTDNWEYSITLDIEQFHREITVGFNQGASTSFDTDYDSVTPPQPPMGLYTYIEHPDEVSFLQKLSKSIVGHQENYDWILVIKSISVDGSVAIHWDQMPTEVEITINHGSDMFPIQEGETVIQVSQGMEYRLTINAHDKEADQPVEEENTDTEEIITEEGPNIEPDIEEIIEPVIPNEEENINITIEADPIDNNEPPTNVTEPSASTVEEPTEVTVQMPVEIRNIEFTPQTPEPNQEITLTVTLHNPDEHIQDYILEINIDSKYAQTKTGSIAPGQEKKVSYTFEITEKGEHTVKVNEEYVTILVGSTQQSIGFPVIPVLIGVIMFVYVTRRFA